MDKRRLGAFSNARASLTSFAVILSSEPCSAFMQKNPLEQFLAFVGWALTASQLFLRIDSKAFHLKHYARGFRKKVLIGSEQLVGMQGLPGLLGELRLGSVDWHFTPAVEGVKVNNKSVTVGIETTMRPLSSICWRETRIVGVLPRYAEYQRLRRECPICHRGSSGNRAVDLSPR